MRGITAGLTSREYMTQASEIKPNFFIIGTFKGGTTSLHQYLSQHPDVFMPRLKETRYFAFVESASCSDGKYLDKVLYPIRTQEQYLSLFEAADGQKAIGEASPVYLDNPGVAKRIASFAPEAKIIVSLRDPVARAVSGYQMWVRSGKEQRPPNLALRPGERWLEGSIYAPKLQKYYEHFPRENIKVILFEDLVKNATDVVCDLFGFLNVARDFGVDTRTTFNSGGMPRSRFAQRSMNQLKTLARGHPELVKFAPKWLHRTYHSARTRNLQPIDIPEEIERRLARYFVDDAKQVARITGLDTAVWQLRERSLT
jgi:hypothetical protein